MPVHLERQADKLTEREVHYILPGGRRHLYSEDAEGKLTRSYIICCDDDDFITEVFQLPQPARLTSEHDASELIAECTDDTLIKRLRDGEELCIDLDDIDEGYYTVVIEHSRAITFN